MVHLFGYSLGVITNNHKSIDNVVRDILTQPKVHFRLVLCFNEHLLP